MSASLRVHETHTRRKNYGKAENCQLVPAQFSDARTLCLNNLYQLCRNTVHVHIHTHVCTYCLRCLYCKAKIGKNVLLFENTRIILLTEKINLHEFGHAVVLGLVNNLYAFCQQFKLNKLSNTL